MLEVIVLTLFIGDPFKKTRVHYCPPHTPPLQAQEFLVPPPNTHTGHLQAQGALNASAEADPVMYGSDDSTSDTGPGTSSICILKTSVMSETS